MKKTFSKIFATLITVVSLSALCSAAETVFFGFDDNRRPQRDRGLITKEGEKGFTFNHTVAAALRYAGQFAAAIKSCTFPQMTGVNYETCSSCPWRRICRTTYTVGRDEV